ncbi:hypothetical protein M406DRAFT_39065, partial [Cryphonectria parasitica EP155]
MPTLHVPAGSSDHLQNIADALWKAKKVVVITGAGISTNSGIPDFRSENGLYSMIQSQSPRSLSTLKGRELFDSSIWSDPLKTSVFYTFATNLRQKSRDASPTGCHHFINHLSKAGKMVRCYTQNIDLLEDKVGLSTRLLLADSGTSTPEHNKGVECVFLHGSLRALRCFQCGCVADWDEGDRELQTMSGQQPPCPRCEDATVARQERGKRALGVGKLRPDIVLYGEEHPESHRISTIIQHDISLAPDMLIVMGTSLKVHGLKTVVREFAKTVHNRKDGKVIFVNYTKPADSVWADVFDFWIEMDCDAWVQDLKEKKPIMWLPPGSVEE